MYIYYSHSLLYACVSGKMPEKKWQDRYGVSIKSES